MNILSPRRTLLIAAVATVATACGGTGSAGTWTYSPPLPTTGAGGSPGASASTGASGAPSASASGGTSPTPPASTAPSSGASGSPAASGAGSPAASPAPSGAAGGDLAFEETATLQITQNGAKVDQVAVKKGGTYTFKITNAAGFPHNFYIGTAEQLANSPNPPTGDVKGVPDFASGTQEFQYTFTADPSTLQFACVVPGHYPLMHGSFTAAP